MNRRQASLYLPNALHVESLRRRHNPVQARLIPAHVTLCREDEVDDWDAVRETLLSVCPFELTLEFGAPVREHNFVFLPVRKGLDAFHAFRRTLLKAEPRQHIPHVTIIHPRNGTCTDSIFEEIASNIEPFPCTFREVMLIEQKGDGPWFPFARTESSVQAPIRPLDNEQRDRPT